MSSSLGRSLVLFALILPVFLANFTGRLREDRARGDAAQLRLVRRVSTLGQDEEIHTPGRKEMRMASRQREIHYLSGGGKKRGEGNGVVPIKTEFINQLRKQKWTLEGKAKNFLGQGLGDFDAVIVGPEGPIVVEWETENISSSHRSLNKLTMLVSDGVIAAGTLVVPSRKLYVYLTDRIGNYKELEPYLKLWKCVPCQKGVLEIVVVEHDAVSRDVPRIPKTTGGRALG